MFTNSFLPNIKKPSDNDTAIVVFSGGIDSTASLIWAYLNYKHVQCVSINSSNISNSNWQKEIRTKILNYINDNNTIGISKTTRPFNTILNSEINISLYNTQTEFTDYAYSETHPISHQAMMWASLISPVLKSNCDVIFGYIKNDIFWEFKYKIIHIIDSFIFVKELKNTNIFYPFEHIEKKEIVLSLEYFNKDILKMCGYCETPKVENNIMVNCGVCDKCLQVIQQINDSDLLSCTNICKNIVVYKLPENQTVDECNCIQEKLN